MARARGTRTRGTPMVATYAIWGGVGSILVGCGALMQGETVAGVIAIGSGAATSLFFAWLFRDRRPSRAAVETGFVCVKCGSLQTDTITEFQPDGSERDRRKCFACDHVWG